MDKYDRQAVSAAIDEAEAGVRILRYLLAEAEREEATVTPEPPQLKVLPPGISWASHIGLADFIDEFIDAAQVLSEAGIKAEIAHTGGGIHVMYVTEGLTDVETFWYGLSTGPNTPRLGITPSDETDGLWLVGTYLSDEDEGQNYKEVDTPMLAAEIANRRVKLRIEHDDWWRNVTEAISSWPPHLNNPLESTEFGLNHRVTLMSTVPVLVTECDGGMTSITETRLDVFMVERAISVGGEQGFIVRWSDFVANDWAVVFDSYGEALEYQARLLYAISVGVMVDEITPMVVDR